ncbi:MAG: phage major capsid protein [Rhizobiales bacterium]|nr:phage major capsid protein [Hyphomicrobiales bacterium]
MSLELILKACEGIETKLKTVSEKADGEIATLGKVTADTKTAMQTLGTEQRVLADRIQQLEQRATPVEGAKAKEDSWGAQLIKAKSYEAFAGGHTNKLRVEVKNTLTGSDTNVAPARAPGVVSGAFQPLTLESFLPSMNTASNAVEFTRENVFTNSAAEAAEGAAKAESALTWTLVNMPISTVAHWIKISRQLAADNSALASYVDTRMRYGVNLKVETQLGAGDGVAPNISGVLDAGNFTAHGYTNAALTAISATFKKLILIRKMLADTWAAGFPADGILLNPADWATIEIELLTTAAGQQLYSVSDGGVPRLFGVPVIQSIGMTADNVAVGAFGQAYMIHNREGVVVEMSDSDSDNFTKNLITIRAERRLALATERPAAVRAGDLTPA